MELEKITTTKIFILLCLISSFIGSLSIISVAYLIDWTEHVVGSSGAVLVEMYDKKVLYKKAGYFFERHQESLGIKKNLLSVMEKRTGNMKKYLNEEALNGDGVLVKRWGLIVPKTLQEEGDVFV
ncbi:hypothetical protein [Candidatus Contubernalis alkaliaceticus]|uniref:hypothetical protein n=1 Tax=Candidatus Contubernalis alkaliaceticus TaxID=338645 RepID=UPI001F4BD314|nr:hypothetical protein [Candidatus Contubernalis alkalaceticus]UNC92061.1 hypothetical protein HUE98_08105 [Candidatus Contubernalis alkalaceticus]